MSGVVRSLGILGMLASCLLPISAAAPPTSAPAESAPASARSRSRGSWRQAYARVFPDRVSLLRPQLTNGSPNAPHVFFTYSNGGLNAWDIEEGRALWPKAVRCSAEPRLLCFDKGRALFASRHHVFAVALRDGHTLWQFGEIPKHDPDSDPEIYPPLTEFAASGGHLFVVRDRRSLYGVQADTGQMIWAHPVEHGTIEHLLVQGDEIHVANMTGGGQTAILTLATRTGRLLRTAHLPPQREKSSSSTRLQAMLPGAGHTLLMLTKDALLLLDTATGRIERNVPLPSPPLVSTITINGASLCFGDANGRVTQYELQSGKRLWTYPALGQRPGDPLWLKADPQGTLAATPNALAMLDPHRGRLRWKREDPGLLAHATPLQMTGLVLTVAAEAKPESKKANPPDGKTRFRIRGIEAATGKDAPASEPLLTEPIRSFSGIHVAGGRLLLLDATRIICYVRSSDPGPTSRPAGGKAEKVPLSVTPGQLTLHRPGTKKNGNEDAMTRPVEITCIVEPNFGENAYVVWSEPGGACWVIDPGFPPSAKNAMEFIREKDLKLEAILLTHGHLDHIAGVVELHEAFPEVPVYIAKEEAAALTDPTENLSEPFGAPLVVGDVPTRDLPPGGELTLNGTVWKILDTSGHSPGGRSFYSESGMVFVGDALFAGGIGRTDFHHSKESDLYEHIRECLYALPENTQVYSGHGPATTIGDEKRSNPFVRG